MSLTICWKSPVASGWNTIPALPRDVMPCSVSSVTYAVVIANSRSGAGAFSLRLPSRASMKPMALGSLRGRRDGALLELLLEAAQALDPGLHRRVGREEVEQRLLRARREDVEGVELGVRPQVVLRDALHRAADLQQRRGQRARAARDDRGAAVGRELAIARQGHHQEVRDDVDQQRDEDQAHDAGAASFATAPGAAVPAA